MTQLHLIESDPLPAGTVVQELPVFPLPNLVFFPNTLLPLHVFEPRYRALVRHAMEGDRRFGVALLQDGYEAEYHGAPPIHPVLCVGEVVTIQTLPDGRSNLLLRGLARARVLDELRTSEEFRVMRVQVEPSEMEGRQGDQLDRQMATVRQLFATIISRVPQMSLEDAAPLFSPDADQELVLDAVASSLPASPGRKQELLAERNLVRRAELLSAVLAETLADSPSADGPSA